MKLELRNVKHMPSLSEETNAYTATVYLDGKKFCEVRNDGQGGSDRQYTVPPFKQSDLTRVNEWLAKNGKPLDMSAYGKENVPCDLELWCGEQLTQHLIAKDLNRALKSRLLFVVPDGDGKIRETRYRGRKTLQIGDVQNLSQSVQQRYPGARILNTMPFAEALAIWSAQSNGA